MSVFVRRFANGFLLNEEGARIEEGRLYMDELELIEAVAEKLGIDLDAVCLSELSKPEPQSSTEQESGESELQSAATPEQMEEIAKTPEYLESLKDLGLPNTFHTNDAGEVIAAGISNGSTEQPVPETD